jgi:exodeoxyribonuclease VII large subunit
VLFTPAVSGGRAEIVTVAELDRRLRRAVEAATGSYWVEGEISSLKLAASGHAYFTLKDEREDATIECVMYRFDAQRARRHLVDGARLQLWGKATLWAPRGRLQLVGTFARPAGRGALLEALEVLKERLGAEGLFAPERKRALPRDPRIIGIVTSAQGAAFHDIKSVAFRRANVRLVLAHAQVQGEDAPESILAALDRIEGYPGLDVLILGRGGGSGEDLMAFNDERVVRRIAIFAVPVVSAVGHEVDTTLADLVADVRAATPSQAAELVVPDLRVRLRELARARAALARAMSKRLELERAKLMRLRAELTDPRFLLLERQQEVDELSFRLRRRLERLTALESARLSALRGRLQARHPRAVIARSKSEFGPLRVRLDAALKRRLAAGKSELADAAGRLDALSPLAVLSRGYALASSEAGRVLRSGNDVKLGERVAVRLGDGGFRAVVDEVHGTSEGGGGGNT